MKILYLSNSCSEKEYNLINEGVKTLVNMQGVKFNRLFAEGLAGNNADVTMISGRPVNFDIHKKTYYRKKEETVNGVKYIYPAFYNYIYIRQILLIINAEREIKRWCKKNKDGVILCDVLNYSMFLAASSIAKKEGIKLIGIVTDLPEILAGEITEKVEKQNKLISECDGLVLLAEPMSDKINPYKKPYVIMEGFSDSKILNIKKEEEKYEKKVLMYAGLLHQKYGIKNLIDAFTEADIKDSELHIYGYGDYEEEIKKIAEHNSKVKFFGTVHNEEILKEERKVTLLVNPRPTDEEFVKYSFPSKNMEYMSSGTPMLTTDLPSMPEEYKDYCFVSLGFDKESIKEKIIEILNMDSRYLQDFGKSAKEWVLKNKNNIAQTKKVIDFVKGI